jgi:phage repressor protein C with HTH and peptisase S24 domain
MISKFQQELSGYSNHKLYLKIKNTIVRDFIHNKDSDYLLNFYLDEAAIRSPRLYDDALEDANTIIDSIRLEKLKSNIRDIIRTDYIEQKDQDFLFDDDGGSLGTYNIEELTGIDFDNLLITKVSGDSMRDAGIFNGDVIFADTKASINSGDIVIASVNGAFYIKEYKTDDDKIFLISKNPDYKPVEITNDMKFELKGKVINVMHRVNTQN